MKIKKKKNIKNIYEGWELQHFDNSKNFRKYQYDLIKKFIKGNVAEVGPGNGENLKLYYKKCKKIDLYEPSYNLYKKLKIKYKKKTISIKNSNFKIKKNKYDTIIYLDVLEHIRDDVREINKAISSIKKGGNLIINVPAFQHLFSKFDKDVGHFRRYNKHKILNLLKKLNYNIFFIKYYDSIGYFLSLLSKLFSSNYKINFKNKIKIWNSLIIISKLIDKLIFHSFGKSLIVVINKS